MEPKINTLFYWCNNVAEMRDFYSGLLGLKETYFLDDEAHGWLTYSLQGVQVVFMRASQPLPVQVEWARQPGWLEGTQELPSLVLELTLEDFQQVVERFKAKGTHYFEPEPRGDEAKYLKQFVMDPMGFTIELYYQAPEN
jgi:extradiol dioxygenase family protein